MRTVLLLAAAVVAVTGAATTATAPAADPAESPVLRWQGHDGQTSSGPARACRRDPCRGRRGEAFPIGGGAWIRIHYTHAATSVNVRLARVTSQGVRYVSSERTAGRHSDVRWQVTLPRDLRRANVLELTVVDPAGERRQFHTYVTR